MGADDGCEPGGQGPGLGRLGILPDQLQQELDAVVRVRLDLVLPQRQPARVIRTPFEVIEVQQSPGGLGDLRVELEGLQPAALGLGEAGQGVDGPPPGEGGPRGHDRVGRSEPIQMP